MKRMKRGFTLIELMIVVAIIIILASLAVPSFKKYRETSMVAKCVSNLRGIQDARETYFMTHVGVDKITGNETDFLSYFGSVSSAEGSTDVTLADSDLVVCPYNDAGYTLGVELSLITAMPVCPNAGTAECSAHIYTAN